MAMATRPPKNKWGLIKWERGWGMGDGGCGMWMRMGVLKTVLRV